MELDTEAGNGRESCQIRVVHLDRVQQAREEAPDEKHVLRLARTYKLLGDPTRLRILMALSAGEMCVCDLSAYLGVSESAVSYQLARLRDLNLVRQRRAGKILYNSLDDAHVAKLLELGLEHIREEGIL